MAVLAAVGLATATFVILATSPQGNEPPNAAPLIDTSSALPFVAGFSGPQAMAFDPSGSPFDPSGSLVVLDRLGGEIARVNILRDGTAGDSTVIGRYFDDLDGLALDDRGSILFTNYGAVLRLADQSTAAEDASVQYVAQQWHQGRVQFDPSVVATNLATGFTEPFGAATARNGDLYVADHSFSGSRITQISLFADGTVASTTEAAVVPNDTGLGVDIALGPTDELFVLNSHGDIWQVSLSSSGPAAVRLFASLPGEPTSLAIDASGTPHVGTRDGTVHSVGRDGTSMPIISGFDPIDALEFDATGVLYVAVEDQVWRLPVLESGA
ncbi:MAG: hypothetical protein ACR2N7_12395 [Acidimicrobiia bacterium]